MATPFQAMRMRGSAVTDVYKRQHKARVAQRQVARDADDEVKGDGHDDIGRDGNQLTGDHARNHMVRLHKEHDGERHKAHGVRNKVVTRLLVFKKLHNAHLHLLGDVLAQEAGRLDEQDDDQNTKDDGDVYKRQALTWAKR